MTERNRWCPRSWSFIFSVMVYFSAFSQPETPPEFGPPVDIPMKLSGNFGEIRRNHFHTGIDIKTQGVQGKNILAIADGYVSRLRISTRGYGLALYIDHPSGHTSVYAHLREFNELITEYAFSKQYELESYMIDYYPEPGDLPVKKGEVIALSGNSGSSSGPHLHFEIRDTESEYPLNVMDLGYRFEDDTRPIIQGLRIYPLSEDALVEGRHAEQSFTVTKSGAQKHTNKDTILVAGQIGVALHTYDKMGTNGHKYGVYGLDLSLDGELWYSHRMDTLSFETFRYVNTHADYHLYKKNKWRYHKCFLSANNQLGIYETMKDRGRISMSEGEVRHLLFRAVDANGNESTLETTLKGVAAGNVEAVEDESIESAGSIILHANSDNSFRTEDFVLLVPRGSLYDDLRLRYRAKELDERSLSRIHVLQDQNDPIQEPIVIKIALNRAVSDSSQLLIVDIRNGIDPIGGESVDGWVEARVRNWGTFMIMKDSLPPTITEISGIGMANGRHDLVTLRISDDLSGIDGFRAEVDGRWLRMKHNNAKTYASGSLKELELAPGRHTFTIRARDAVGNAVRKELDFVVR